MDKTDMNHGPIMVCHSQPGAKEAAMPASRTPEGEPIRCAVCGAVNEIDLAATGGDAPCAGCGCLLWQGRTQAAKLHNRLSGAFGLPADEISCGTRIGDIADDSLATIELVMELEEELQQQGIDMNLTDDEARGVKTVGDALRLIMERRRMAGLD